MGGPISCAETRFFGKWRRLDKKVEQIGRNKVFVSNYISRGKNDTLCGQVQMLLDYVETVREPPS